MKRNCQILNLAIACAVMSGCCCAVAADPEKEYLIGHSGRTTSRVLLEMSITAETAKAFQSSDPDCADVIYRTDNESDGRGMLVVRFKKPGSVTEVIGPVIDIPEYGKDDGIAERLIELEMNMRAVNPANSKIQFRVLHATNDGKMHTVKSLMPTFAGAESFFYFGNLKNFQPWSIVKSSGRSYFNRTKARVMMIVEPQANDTEVQIRSLSLREHVSISHVISVPAYYNTFLCNTGCVSIAWVKPGNIREAKVILENEEKKVVSEQVIAKGEKKSVIKLPHRGYYRIRAKAVYEDGSELSAFSAALVAGDKLPEDVRRKSRYGLCNVQMSASLAMDLGSNQNYHLYNFHYDVKKGENGEIKPKYYSVYAKDDPRRPMRHMSGQNLYPSWAQDPKQRNSTDLHVPYDWDLYEKVVTAYFKNIPEFPDTICWQNEPDTRFFVKDEDFVECHTRFADIVKKVRPDAKIAAYCSYGIFPESVDRLVKKGILKHAEWFHTHNYAPGIPEGEFISRIQKLKAVLADNGHAGMPIAITEFGWQSKGKGASSYQGWSELDKARFAARSMILATTEDVKALCLFDGRGGGRESNSFSCYRSDNLPLPQAASFATLAKELADVYSPGRWIKFAPGVHIASFERRGKALWAMWCEQGETKLCLPQKPASVVSMCGSAISPTQEIVISPSPVYVEFADASLAGIRVVETRELLQTDAFDVPGIQFVASGLRTAGDKISFTNAVKGEYTVFCQTVGKYELRIFRLLEGVTASFKGYENKIDEGRLLLSYDLNSQYQNLNPQVSASIKSSGDRIAYEEVFDLQDGANTRVVELSAENGKRLQGKIDFSIEKPFAWRDKIEYDVTALSFPKFDGEAIDWKQVPVIVMNDWSTKKDTDRYHCDKVMFPVDWQCAMNDKGISFRVVAYDKKHIQEDLWTMMWKQDSLQLMVDLDADDEWEPNNIGGNRYQGHRLTSYGFARKRDGNAMKWCYQAFAETVRSGPAFGAKCAITRDDRPGREKTVYEIHLPWKELGTDEKPDLNRQIGISLLLNDFDGEKRRMLPFGHGVVNIKNAPESARVKFYKITKE